MQKKWLPKLTVFGKWTIIILLAFILIWPLTVGLYWAVYKGYTAIDRTRFADLDAMRLVYPPKNSAIRALVARSQRPRRRMPWDECGESGAIALFAVWLCLYAEHGIDKCLCYVSCG